MSVNHKRPIQFQFIYNKSSTFGLKRDCELIESALRRYGSLIGLPVCKARHLDFREPPQTADVQIHMEIPTIAVIPWAPINYLMVNPEWFHVKEWSPYLQQFTGILCKDEGTVAQLEAAGHDNIYFIPWSTTSLNKEAKTVLHPQHSTGQAHQQPRQKKQASIKRKKEFITFCGGSKNKLDAVTVVANAWKPQYPPLTVYTTLTKHSIETMENVKVISGDISIEKRRELLQTTEGYLGVSLSEGFGHAIAEAEQYNCFMILNDQPVFKQYFPASKRTQYIESTKQERPGVLTASWIPQTDSLDTVIGTFMQQDVETAEATTQSEDRWIKFIESLKQVFVTHLESPTGLPPKKLPVMPPILLPNDCPKISIVTLLHNRRKFANVACHNLLITDYPHNKIEWVVVDDSESDKSASDIIIGFGNKSSDLTITYIPLDGKRSIGEKRNIGVERAEHDIILFMDDDDHYPVTSFRRRVAWLTAYPKKDVAVCTTIACYDLMRGISSVNIPPWKLSQGSRISEATLTFRRSFWRARSFPLTNIAEGEEWINGRETAVIEMPPQQIIVAFTHNQNTSSRNVPGNEHKPGCFWGFPREYLEFIHGIVGVKVEAE